MTCRDCHLPMAVMRTAASLGITTRVHQCGCGSRWETVEKISRRLSSVTATPSTPLAHRQHTGSKLPLPVAHRQQPPSGGGVGGGVSSDPNSVLFPASSGPSEQSGSVSEGDQGVDRRAREPRYTDAFSRFWAAYPRKTAKGAAWKAWPPAAAHLEAILAALEWQRASDDWQRDGGAFVPHPATWLNARRWEDEPTAIGPALPEKARVSRMAAIGWLNRKEQQGG